MSSIEKAVKKAKATGQTGAPQKRHTAAIDKFASLSPSLLARDSGADAVITRADAKVYSQDSATKTAQLHAAPRVAVTFRMNKSEFFRLRKGANKIGAQPRDIVKRAISNCLDAYGVAPASDKTGV